MGALSAQGLLLPGAPFGDVYIDDLVLLSLEVSKKRHVKETSHQRWRPTGISSVSGATAIVLGACADGEIRFVSFPLGQLVSHLLATLVGAGLGLSGGQLHKLLGSWNFSFGS